jgi:hypothetical protein
VDFNGPHAKWGGKSVLVCVDYFSRFVIAKFFKSTDMGSVAAALEPNFQLLGSPKSIRSDNGPPFNGGDWDSYCADRGMSVEKSTPGFPQQNGLVERYMQIVNKALSIAAETADSPEKLLEAAIDAHNMATQRTTNASPEVLLFGRIRRERLPVAQSTPRHINREELRARDTAEKSKARDRENVKRRARQTSIAPGTEVLLRRQAKSEDQTGFDPTRFKIVEGSRRDFVIEDPNGRRFKRNVRQLKKVSGPPASNNARGNAREESRIDKGRPRRKCRVPSHLYKCD